MSGLPYVLISSVLGFLIGAIVGAWLGGIPGITIGGILFAWLVMYLLRRKHASAE